ncbi:hypothetical protein F5B19DRAFT_455932 [Rostrohypoxylon terebratum]|nr:hypothetical protein F5B19DRAFT_455932 [Rostrohypoxylon terebratum]
MGRTRFSLLQLGLLLEASASASASRLIFPPAVTQPSNGAFVDVRHPAPTAAPESYASMELLRRDGYNMGHDTCGFGSLDPGLTYTCYSSVGTCEDIGSYRGCCTGGLKACSSTFWTQCDDYNPTKACGTSSKTRCCQSALPYCITWLFSTTGSTFTAWDCDTQSDTRVFDMLATPLSLIDTTASSTTDESTNESAIVGATISSPTAATTNSPTAESSTSPADNSSSTSASSSSDSNSGTPVGAIVGGVVGGLAVIAFVVIGVFFIRKYQRGSSTAVLPPPAPSGPQELPGIGTQQLKHELPMAEASVVYEIPNTPAAGTGHNRAELA